MKTRYTDDHEWASHEDGDIVTIGITDYAQGQLGDIVYVELPDIGREVEKGEDVAVIESVKAAGEVKSPVGGVVEAVNEELDERPELINESAEEAGWVCRIRCTSNDDFDSLMDADQYRSLVDSLS
ncbi:MAG: glycine cleavage system protein GcvH [Gammaproteobacteria bacterium]|nr:glycine cleavage system protein GcvH [Gammaproteobacteria bacterium]MYD75339.1 glycine cleavage system protein GcvH [Gammaproteobacteria bacterium]MYJ51428.1 glycine cleavage system protein GcvH [Gammaproteobacteria bacterium]